MTVKSICPDMERARQMASLVDRHPVFHCAAAAGAALEPAVLALKEVVEDDENAIRGAPRHGCPELGSPEEVEVPAIDGLRVELLGILAWSVVPAGSP